MRWSSNRLCGWSIWRPRLRANSANSSSLKGSGSGWARRRKQDLLRRQVRRDGLVGREHELLDHLVALVVDGQVGAGDLALLAQVDLDLGQVQLQRPAGEPAAAEDHGQLEHPAQHRRDLRGRRPGCSASGSFITAIACS